MTWKDILKMTFDEASNKATKIMMERYNPDGMAGVAMDFATIPKYREEYSNLVQSFMKEEDLPEDVKRARERVRQGLPSKEMPLIPQFNDDSKKSSTDLPDETKEALEKLTRQLKEAFEGIDHELVMTVLLNLNKDGKRLATTQKELVDMMVENTIKRLKSDRLYR
jgi:hypothetical protein